MARVDCLWRTFAFIFIAIVAFNDPTFCDRNALGDYFSL